MGYRTLMADREVSLPAEIVQLRRLLACLMSICIQDIRQYVDNPVKTERFLRKYDDSIGYTVSFLRECGQQVLSFLLGQYRGRIFYQRLLPYIDRAETIYRTVSTVAG